MHNKSFTVDGHATILGGRNIGDEYFATGPTALYVDLDVLAVGRVVDDVSSDFDRYWRAGAVHPARPIVGAAREGDPLADRLSALEADPQLSEYRQILQSSDIVSALAAGDETPEALDRFYTQSRPIDLASWLSALPLDQAWLHLAAMPHSRQTATFGALSLGSGFITSR